MSGRRRSSRMARKRRFDAETPTGTEKSYDSQSDRKGRVSPRARAEARQIEEAIRMSLSPPPPTMRSPAPPPTLNQLQVGETARDVEPLKGSEPLGNDSGSPEAFHGFETPTGSAAKTPPEACMKVDICAKDDPFTLAKYRQELQEALSKLGDSLPGPISNRVPESEHPQLTTRQYVLDDNIYRLKRASSVLNREEVDNPISNVEVKNDPSPSATHRQKFQDSIPDPASDKMPESEHPQPTTCQHFLDGNLLERSISVSNREEVEDPSADITVNDDPSPSAKHCQKLQDSNPEPTSNRAPESKHPQPQTRQCFLEGNFDPLQRAISVLNGEKAENPPANVAINDEPFNSIEHCQKLLDSNLEPASNHASNPERPLPPTNRYFLDGNINPMERAISVLDGEEAENPSANAAVGDETIKSPQCLMMSPKVPEDEFLRSPGLEESKTDENRNFKESDPAKLVEEAINSYEEYRKTFSAESQTEEPKSPSQRSVDGSSLESACQCSRCSNCSDWVDEDEEREEEEESLSSSEEENSDELEIRDTRLTLTHHPELMKYPTSVYQCELCDRTYKGWNCTIIDHMQRIHFAELTLTEEERAYYLTDVEKFIIRKPILFTDKKRI